jgi:hypothetical protein
VLTIRSITLTDFGPFKDEQRIEFPVDGGVSILYGENMRGKESGVIDPIRLAKLWKVRNGLPIRTFVLELAVIKTLEDKKKAGFSDQMEHFWKELRDNSTNLSVEDLANPTGNDLSKELDDNLKAQLAAAAKRTLTQIDESGWEAVYGEAEKKEKAEKVQLLRRAASVAVAPARPWLP